MLGLVHERSQAPAARLPFVILGPYPVASALSCLKVRTRSIRSRQTTPLSYFNINRDMADEAVQEYLSDKNQRAIPVFMAFRQHALAAGEGVTEKVSRTMVAWKHMRTFATAYVKGKYLECSIDLLHPVEHKHLKVSLHTTKKVVTNRFTL
jgi:predicted transport protein